MNQTHALPYSITVLLPIILISIGVVWSFSFIAKPSVALSSTGTPITGYGWSDTIGWISFNCTNDNSCDSSNYGMYVDSSGSLHGYGWSDSIGWVSAEPSDISGCPSSPCTPTLSGTTLTGWFRALAGAQESDGWDGWISLNGSGYGPTLGQNNFFSGYVWGSDVVGWIDFSQVFVALPTCTPSYSCQDSSTILYHDAACQTTTYTTCESPTFCATGSSICLYPNPTFVASGQLTGHLQLTPKLVQAGQTTMVTWNVENVESCSVTGDNSNAWTGLQGEKQSSPITKQTRFTLVCDTYENTQFVETKDVYLAPAWQEF